MALKPLIRLQGLLFCALAFFTIVLHIWLPIQNTLVTLWVLTIVILSLGVPHGAFDTVYAKHIYGLKTKLQWALFVALYIGLAAGVVVVWIVFPSGFLIGFLVLSLIHFSGDPDNGVSGLFRAVYAGGALVFPAYAHEAQVSELFAFLSNPATANQIASFLHGLSYPWIFLAVVATLLNFKKNGQAALELLCVCLLALLTPPLVSFTVFFCFMHGLRHFLRTRDYVVPASFKHLFRLGCAPIVATAVLMAFAWYGLKAVTIEAHLIQWLFISLAALTVPHMLLVDRLRFLP